MHLRYLSKYMECCELITGMCWLISLESLMQKVVPTVKKGAAPKWKEDEELSDASDGDSDADEENVCFLTTQILLFSPLFSSISLRKKIKCVKGLIEIRVFCHYMVIRKL